MKKKNTFKILIILIDIIVIAFIVFLYLKWNEKRHNNNQIDNTQQFVFKDFTFKRIPQSMKFENESEDIFKITGSDWYANVEVVYDPDAYLITYNKYYEEALIKDGYTIHDNSKKDINDNYVIVSYVTKNDKNLILCELETNYDFAYEIELYSNDNTYIEDKLDDIVKVLINGKYEDDPAKEYHYMYPFKDWTLPETEE